MTGEPEAAWPTAPAVAPQTPGAGELPVVLIVEDERPLRDLLGHLFERDGFRVVKAANGQQALSAVQTNGQPHVAIVDLLMPVLDGGAFLERAFAAGPRFPALLVSASPEAAAVAAKLGIGHIPKPFDWHTVRAWVRNSLGMAER